MLTKEDGSAGPDKEIEGQTDKERNGDVDNAKAAESVDWKGKTNETEVKLRPMIALCLAYAANIGGTGSLIGTPPNLLLADALEEYDGQPINFLSWMGLALPQVSRSNTLGEQ